MQINEFIKQYTNHPVLFIGTGISLRYLQDTYTWGGLLKKISFDLYDNHEPYLDIQSKCEENGKYNYAKIATKIELEFNQYAENNRNGKFKEINDIFYENMSKNINISRFKIYISKILKDLNYINNKLKEIEELKKIRKNIGSIITTNYDLLIEDIFEFNPLIGNDIILSNPYGSVYKIHGCVSDASKIIINSDDYQRFNEKYDLIRSQLLSLFIHNPIIFIGYSVGDENIKNILKTIFTYVEPNTEIANKIKQNFLLIEYVKDSKNIEITDHDIEINGSIIRINKLQTDNFVEVYKVLSEIALPISAMDIRKVQGIANEIYAGGSARGSIKVHFTEDLESLKNSDRIMAIGTSKTVFYHYQTAPEMIQNYFNIIDEANKNLLALIDKLKISTHQYFPIFGFNKINPTIKCAKELQEQQKKLIEKTIEGLKASYRTKHDSIDKILKDSTIAQTYKCGAVCWGIYNKTLDLSDVENYLKRHENKKETAYKKILCFYDFIKYSELGSKKTEKDVKN